MQFELFGVEFSIYEFISLNLNLYSLYFKIIYYVNLQNLNNPS